MSKMHYFSNKFSEGAGGSPLPAPLNLRYWWPKVVCVFQTDYDEIEFQKNQLLRHFSDVIHRKTSPKLRHNFFPFCPPPQSKLLATSVRH